MTDATSKPSNSQYFTYTPLESMNWDGCEWKCVGSDGMNFYGSMDGPSYWDAKWKGVPIRVPTDRELCHYRERDAYMMRLIFTPERISNYQVTHTISATTLVQLKADSIPTYLTYGFARLVSDTIKELSEDAEGWDLTPNDLWWDTDRGRLPVGYRSRESEYRKALNQKPKTVLSTDTVSRILEKSYIDNMYNSVYTDRKTDIW